MRLKAICVERPVWGKLANDGSLISDWWSDLRLQARRARIAPVERPGTAPCLDFGADTWGSKGFWEELKRRHVYRVAVAYVIVG